MKRLLAQRSVQVVLGIATVTTLLLWISPLTVVHGVESALVLGLVLPPCIAGMSARWMIGRGDRTIGQAARDAMGATTLVLAVPLVGLSLGAIRARWCAPLEGLAFFGLGPVMGGYLAAIAGALVGSVPGRPRLVTLAAMGVPIAVALLGLARFYTTPAIFAYSHFVGYFPGSLYDPDIEITSTYVSFRALTAAWLAAGAAVLVALQEFRAPSVKALRAHPATLPIVVGLVLVGVVGEVYGPELGHRSTAASIREALGTTLEGTRCDVVVPRELPRQQAEVLRDECDFRVTRAEEVLGVTHPGRITAFFFRSASEKRELMGASGTYIAKPWRDEVYLQLGLDPHPVLFHEIVHVVAAATGTGPFRVSGGLGGLFPSPGIVEGVAVAIAWDSREGLTPHQWAAAMSAIDRAPPLEDASGLGFLLQPAGRAYTANGSFLRWVLDTRGSHALRVLYRTGSYEEALGEPLASAEADWREFLRTVPLPPQAVPLARLRFSRSAIFTQVCPHTIAALEGALETDEESGDDAGALTACDGILAIDPGYLNIVPHRVGALARTGRLEEARAALHALEADDEVPAALLTSARTELADALLSRGELAEARTLYEAGVDEPLSDDQARQLEVKLLAIQRGPSVVAPLREVLVPSGRQTHDGATTVEALTRLGEIGGDGLADYLIARQMLFRQRYDLAGPRLTRAMAAGLPSERIQREARRLDGVIRARTGDYDGAERVFRAILAEGDEGARVEADDWLARIRFLRGRRGPALATE
ncbi:MAG: hypothetical protein U0234_23695 [Sandaracinus sp.]